MHYRITTIDYAIDEVLVENVAQYWFRRKTLNVLPIRCPNCMTRRYERPTYGRTKMTRCAGD